MNKIFHLLEYEEKLALLQALSELSVFSLHNFSKKRRLIQKVHQLCDLPSIGDEYLHLDPETIFERIKHKDIKDYFIYFLYSIDKLEKKLPPNPEQTIYLAKMMHYLRNK